MVPRLCWLAALRSGCNPHGGAGVLELGSTWLRNVSAGQQVLPKDTFTRAVRDCLATTPASCTVQIFTTYAATVAHALEYLGCVRSPSCHERKVARAQKRKEQNAALIPVVLGGTSTPRPVAPLHGREAGNLGSAAETQSVQLSSATTVYQLFL